MTLGLIRPKGKGVGGEANGKGNVGPCWKSLIQSELSRGSHKSPDRVRDAKSGNITPIRRKLGRQEWNKTPGIRPSLPPFTKYIDALIKIRDIVISQHSHDPTWSNLQLHLQLATL